MMIVLKVLMYWTLIGAVVAVGFGKLCAVGRGEPQPATKLVRDWPRRSLGDRSLRSATRRREAVRRMVG